MCPGFDPRVGSSLEIVSEGGIVGGGDCGRGGFIQDEDRFLTGAARFDGLGSF